MRNSSLFIGALFLAGAALPLAPATAQDAAGNADYDKRIQRLEEQIVDLSAQLGTVETMGQGGGGQRSIRRRTGFARRRRAAATMADVGARASGNPDDGLSRHGADRAACCGGLQRIEQQRSGRPRAVRTARDEQGTGFSVGGADKEADGADSAQRSSRAPSRAAAGR